MVAWRYMDYFFVLGNHPALSLSELEAKLTGGRWQVINNHLAVVSQVAELPTDLLTQLGGTIKFGRIIAQVKQLDQTVVQLIAEQLLAVVPTNKKIYFGLSNYSQQPLGRDLGINIKRWLQEAGRSVRWVTSRETALSSVVVEQNNLLTNGGELVFGRHNNYWQIGLTIAVQPFKALSARDYGRPARDDQSGMLPPKLAQIILNLAGLKPGDSILDPFCGSGTILQEAALMQAGRIIGLDSSDVAVANSQINWQWLANRWTVTVAPEISLADARQASTKLAGQKINCIVTEPYLGPQRGQRDFVKIRDDLNQLYSQALTDWQKIIAPGGRVVMVWPVFIVGRQKYLVQPQIIGWRQIEYSQLAKQTWPQQYTSDGYLLYGRDNQVVWRAIIGLERD